MSRPDYPQPNGWCHQCNKAITPDWSQHCGGVEFFCSEECIANNWCRYAEVPRVFWSFDAKKARCGPKLVERVKKWAQMRSVTRQGPPGLLLYSQESGTSKTFVGTYATK